MRLADKVAIVTGAASGIGRATCYRFAAGGAAVVCRQEDVAAAALFLASDDAAFVTGSVLVVDGGVTAGNLGFFM